MTTAYDELAYPTTAFRQTHPDRLATHAAILGLPFAPPRSCRFLDIAGGDGMNAIGMAVTYPDSEFVSFDLSEAAVRRGQEVIEKLGLKNIRLFAADITDVDLGQGAFDYIAAHGLYSWAPAQVRDALLALIGQRLAPHGVAFVSYNAQPGGHVRAIVRDLLLRHIAGIQAPQARIEAARRKLQEVADSYPEQDVFQRALKARCAALLEIPGEVLAHDDLGEIFHPVYLTDFLAHAGRHGLQFLTDADTTRCTEGLYPNAAEAADVALLAQEQDFRRMNGFRQTLLVRREARIDRRFDPRHVAALHATSPAVASSDDTFEIQRSEYKVEDARLAEAVRRVSGAWPLAVPVCELVQDDERLGALLRMYAAGLVRLHVEPSPFRAEVSERPMASPLARLQIARGDARIITLAHSVLALDDGPGRSFVGLLDGSRTHDEIAHEMARITGTTLDEVRAQLPVKLGNLARMPLLTA